MRPQRDLSRGRSAEARMNTAFADRGTRTFTDSSFGCATAGGTRASADYASRGFARKGRLQKIPPVHLSCVGHAYPAQPTLQRLRKQIAGMGGVRMDVRCAETHRFIARRRTIARNSDSGGPCWLALASASCRATTRPHAPFFFPALGAGAAFTVARRLAECNQKPIATPAIATPTSTAAGRERA